MDNVTAVCPLHGVQMEEKTGQYGSFWSHRTSEGFCDGKKIKPFKPQYAGTSVAAPMPITREPIDQGKAEQEKAMWETKDRQSLAQTAMKSASEIVAALISAGVASSLGIAEIDVKKMANEFYKELKEMKKE